MNDDYGNMPIYTTGDSVKILSTKGIYVQSGGTSTWSLLTVLNNLKYPTDLWFICKNRGSGVVTIAPGSGQYFSVNGVTTTANFTLYPNMGAIICWDGFYWIAIPSYERSPAIIGSADLTAQTSAITVLTATSFPGAATLDISGYLNVTAVSTDIIEIQVAYTDENNNARTFTSSTISTTGVNSWTTGKIRVKSSTAVTVTTVFTVGSGSIAYDVGARIVMY